MIVAEADASDGTGNAVVVAAAAAAAVNGSEVAEIVEQLTKCALLDCLGKIVGQLHRKQSLSLIHHLGLIDQSIL